MRNNVDALISARFGLEVSGGTTPFRDTTPKAIAGVEKTIVAEGPEMVMSLDGEKPAKKTTVQAYYAASDRLEKIQRAINRRKGQTQANPAGVLSRSNESYFKELDAAQKAYDKALAAVKAERPVTIKPPKARPVVKSNPTPAQPVQESATSNKEVGMVTILHLVLTVLAAPSTEAMTGLIKTVLNRAFSEGKFVAPAMDCHRKQFVEYLLAAMRLIYKAHDNDGDRAAAIVAYLESTVAKGEAMWKCSILHDPWSCGGSGTKTLDRGKGTRKCPRCNGKGWQTVDDKARNYVWDRHHPRRSS